MSRSLPIGLAGNTLRSMGLSLLDQLSRARAHGVRSGAAGGVSGQATCMPRAPPRPRSAWMPSSALRPTVKPGTYGSKASVHAGVCAPPVLDARALLRPGVESRSGLALQIRALTRARPARVLAGGARRDQGHSAGIHRTASNPAPAPQRSASAEGRIARAPSAGDAVLPFPPGGSICLPALSSSPLMLRTHF